MALPAWLTGLFEPIAKTVDSLHTSQEERGQLRLQLIESQIGMAERVLEYELGLANAKRDVIVAEATGKSWLQRNWRPLLMTVIAAIIGWNYLMHPLLNWALVVAKAGVEPPPILELPADLWTLLQIGVGGYIVGRSAEKVTDTLAGKGLSFGKKDGE